MGVAYHFMRRKHHAIGWATVANALKGMRIAGFPPANLSGVPSIIALAVRDDTHIIRNNYFHIVKYSRGMAWL
jgi:hypothetical protein